MQYIDYHVRRIASEPQPEVWRGILRCHLFTDLLQWHHPWHCQVTVLQQDPRAILFGLVYHPCSNWTLVNIDSTNCIQPSYTRSPAVARMADRTAAVVKLTLILPARVRRHLGTCHGGRTGSGKIVYRLWPTAGHAHCSNSYHGAVAQGLLYVAQT